MNEEQTILDNASADRPAFTGIEMIAFKLFEIGAEQLGEIDQLKAINAELLSALQAIAGPNHTFFRNCAEIHKDEILQARAAIASATGGAK